MAGDGTQPDASGNSGDSNKMEELKAILQPMRRHMERLQTQLIEILKKEGVKFAEVQPKFKEFMDTFLDIQQYQVDLKRLIGTSGLTPEKQDDEYIQISRYYSMAEEIRNKVDVLIKADEQQRAAAGPSAPSSVAGDSTGRGIRLPEYKIGVFDGELKDWLRFWAQFQRVHNNPDFSGSEKFWFLLEHLKPGSEPYDMLAQVPQTDGHYKEAVETLQKRFGDNDLLINTYVRELMNVMKEDEMPFEKLFLKIDSNYRALKTLQLEKADPDTWLYAMVEASLPHDILYKWNSTSFTDEQRKGKSRLELLLKFMENERDIRARMKKQKKKQKGLEPTPKAKRDFGPVPRPPPPRKTTAYLSKAKIVACIFCGETGHRNRDCPTARFFSYQQRMSLLRKNGLCFICVYPHMASVCRNKDTMKCTGCGGGHHVVICPSQNQEEGPSPKRIRGDNSEPPSTSMSTQVSSVEVCLQTLRLKIFYEKKNVVVRAFLDSGSMRSYMSKDVALALGLTPTRVERMIHSLFSGHTTGVKNHNVYGIYLSGLDNNNSEMIVVRDIHRICADISTLDSIHARIQNVLRRNGVHVTDIGATYGQIDLLIGADWYGSILTGNIKQLENGLTAIETKFGWTLIGVYRDPNVGISNVTSFLAHDKLISNLWELDVMGIKDPTEILSLNEKEKQIKETFLKTVTRELDGRYSIKLPWKDLHPELSTNRDIAMQRLVSTTKKLKASNMFATYDNLLKSWQAEGFIEVTSGQASRLHYLPHRAVIKPESLTTPVRPVFDASCKAKGRVSLNDCLHKGQSYILLIPDIILRLREKTVGFVSDIRKAFQMIGVDEEDRDVLRFLWWTNDKTNEVLEYRHRRVPFGANCSPFILGAVLEKHLTSTKDELTPIAMRLWETVYVDNCCASEPTIEAYEKFKETSVDILAEAKMDLRMWLSNVEDVSNPETRTISVLGLKWDRQLDELFVNMDGIKIPETVTKRTVLSTVSKIFDPVGITAPATLQMKLLLQRLWSRKLKWDETLPEDEKTEFLDWSKEMEDLGNLRIPRNLDGGVNDHSLWELHCMADGSKLGYGTVCYLRVKTGTHWRVSLLAAKAKVAPIKNMTIPRLELLGCLIAARLFCTIRNSLKLTSVNCYFWSDSTTALSWIKRSKEWDTFVGRRVNEINSLTNKEDWFHIPGEFNPADLPSRGCKPKFLLKSNWIDGPAWLKRSSREWPVATVKINEAEIAVEERKTPVVRQTVTSTVLDFGKPFEYHTIVRIQAWVRRFVDNARNRVNKDRGCLKAPELDRAEIDVLRQIQTESLKDDPGESLKGLETVIDSYGVLRLKTRITYRDGKETFKLPAILPKNHDLVRRLIRYYHICYCHAGVGFLRTKLRQKYWILNGRQTIKKITTRCYRCRQFAARATVTETAPLPEDRIKDAEAFETTGVDLAGPFFTKNGKKVWIVIYTCAVYRGVHIKTINSLSTEAFMKSLGEFIKAFRRPVTIYSDNGTNFRGTDNLFRRLNWKKIMEHESVSQIKWKFNPASAPWWGGWWERLIKTMKDLLFKTIGKGLLSLSELNRVIEKIEEVMNDRPLTYVSEDPEDLEPLTPSMFIRPLGLIKFPERDIIDGEELRYRYKYMRALLSDLKTRFHNEYLGMMVSRNPKRPTRPLRVGELVVVACDNKKRVLWPLGKIVDLYEGKDGVSRVAKVKTADGVLVRAVQRLHALEADSDSDPVAMAGELTLRSGRVVKRSGRK